MRVLDLDLDFFLADCCELALKGERPEAVEAKPWQEKEVRRFLECNCGLHSKKRIPGRVFETHDGALFFWRELLEEKMLFAPFDVVHVDAHSDLAIGAPGPRFILEAVLSRPVADRPNLEQYVAGQKLDEANYLLFALAFRWIGRLVNVRNPLSRPDIPAHICLQDENGTLCGMLLRSQISALMEQFNGKEPTVGFEVFGDPALYRETESFDFISLAHSPRYTPAEADFLIDIIRDYIEII